MLIPGLEKLDMVARMNPAKRLKMWPKIVWKSGFRGGILFHTKMVKKRRSETSITTREEKINEKLRINLELVEYVCASILFCYIFSFDTLPE